MGFEWISTETRTIRGREYRLAEIYSNKCYAEGRADAHRIVGQISRYARVIKLDTVSYGVFLGTEKEEEEPIFSNKEIAFCKGTCGNDSPCLELCNDFKTTFNYT
jgi:hypothetical protein